MNRHLIFLTVVSALFLAACGDFEKEYRSTPSAHGKPNQVVIIADESVWEGPVGDSILYFMETPYLMLPQYEPTFDVKPLTPEAIKEAPIRRQARVVMIVADISQEASPTTQMVVEDIGEERLRRARTDSSYNLIIGKNKWAEGQMVIYQMGQSASAIVDNLRYNFTTLQSRIHQFDTEMLRNTAFQAGVDVELTQKIKDKYGFEMQIPDEYQLAREEGAFLWLRKDTRKLTSNILIQTMAYRDSIQLTRAGLIALRDTLGKLHISSQQPNSYMRVNAEDLPLIVDPGLIDGHFKLEARGIWELVNDFKGGPFLTYLILDDSRQRLIFLDGFILAPGEEKRNHMQYLEQIFQTIDIPE